MGLFQFCVGVLCCWDLMVAGLRSRLDMKKVKTSTEHDINAAEGWGCTELVGGRSKLHGKKRGTRSQKVWRLCLCKDGKHKSPPVNVRFSFDRDGNPRKDPEWTTTCPVAAMELMMLLQPGNIRMYPKWNRGRSRPGDGKPHVSHYNTSDCPKFANEWLHSQGVVSEQPFDSNCGRHSLARWCSETGTNYEESFQIHLDLFSTWSQSYQDDVSNPNGFKNRIQSTNPDKCLAAYRRLRKYWGIR